MRSWISVALFGQAAGIPLGGAVRVALPTEGGQAARLKRSRSPDVLEDTKSVRFTAMRREVGPDDSGCRRYARGAGLRRGIPTPDRISGAPSCRWRRGAGGGRAALRADRPVADRHRNAPPEWPWTEPQAELPASGDQNPIHVRPFGHRAGPRYSVPAQTLRWPGPVAQGERGSR